ncbi:hypothetical protein AB6A40_010924 [Gnathostoma spinigerum]|uniref:Uncharacterized protein n=1 Tax=Gnathostoma spinigerum TaxID=75299 RepID=A0ABD6EW99_9BILA
MTDIHLPRAWNILWLFTAPFVTLVLFIFCILKNEPLTYPNGSPYPNWAMGLGYILSSCSMIVIPGYALYYMLAKNKKISYMERLRLGFSVPDDLVTGAQKT